MKDNLGNRMKEFYEARARTFLTRRQPVIIRLDGKAFHTFTRGFNKPFDDLMINSMIETTKKLCENIQGCKLGYVQSDEISLLLTDFDNINTDAWFDYNVQKICSISASMATLYFNNIFVELDQKGLGKWSKKYNTAMFDSRCFSIPKEEVCNYFIWRQQDATRNSILSLSQSVFSHRELQNKNTSQLNDMLFEKMGINFNNIKTVNKRGCCTRKIKMNLINDVGVDYHRNIWLKDYEIPIFSQDREYIEKLIKNGD